MDRVFILESKEEYFWLMEYLEKLGCKWWSGDNPTWFNNRPEYYNEKCISVIDNRVGCHYPVPSDTCTSVKKLRSFTPLSLKPIT